MRLRYLRYSEEKHIFINANIVIEASKLLKDGVNFKKEDVVEEALSLMEESIKSIREVLREEEKM